MSLTGLPALWVLGLGAVAVSVVLLLYTIRWRLPQRIIGTVALWKQVGAKRRGAGRLGMIEQIVSLLLQVLIASALVLAAGRPRLSCQSATGRQVVVVLDRSASMGTQERVASRLDLARQRALSRLASMAATDTMALVLAGGEPEVAVPLGRDPIALKRAVQAAGLRLFSGRLDEAVRRACGLFGQGGAVASSLVVITDGTEPVGDCPGAELELVQVGEARPNVGIIAFAAAIPPQSVDHASVLVRVTNAWRAPAKAELRLDLDGKLLQVSPVELKPGETVTRSFDGINVPERQGGLLMARLDKISFAGGGGDALREDDRAFAVLARPATLPIDLIGESEPVRLVLHANHRYHVTPQTALKPGAGTIQVVVGEVPGPLGRGRYLLVKPTGDGLPFKLGGVVQQPIPTDWAEASEHPVMRRVIFNDVTVDVADKTILPASMTALVSSLTTPLVYVSSDESRRLVGLSFDPSQSNLPMRVGFPVLIYNAISWLAEDKDEDKDNAAEDGGYTVASTAPARVTGPDGKATQLEPEGGAIHLQPSLPGFYQVASLAGAPLATVAANVITLEETQIIPKVVAPKSLLAIAAGRFRDREVAGGLLLLALLLLCLEWVSFHRRVTV